MRGQEQPLPPIKLHWVGCLRVGAGPPKAVVCVCVCACTCVQRGEDMTVWKADGGRSYQAGLMENQTRPTVPFHGVALNLHFHSVSLHRALPRRTS